jgi:hypothetical protein
MNNAIAFNLQLLDNVTSSDRGDFNALTITYKGGNGLKVLQGTGFGDFRALVAWEFVPFKKGQEPDYDNAERYFEQSEAQNYVKFFEKFGL